MSDEELTPESDCSELDSDEEEIPRDVQDALSKPFNKIVEDIERVGEGYYILFDKAYKKDTKVADITKEYVLGLPHLLTNKKVVEPAFKFVNEIEQYKWDCEYGDTQCNNDIWYDYMLPAVEKTLKQLIEKQWNEGFTGLLGMYLFIRSNGGHWIVDQEVYLDEKVFTSFFKKYSKAWKLFLTQDDDVIGLKYAGGLPGGYRENLIDILRKQQDFTNDTILKDSFGDVRGAKLYLVHKNKKKSDINTENRIFLTSVSKENQEETSSTGIKNKAKETETGSAAKKMKVEEEKPVVVLKETVTRSGRMSKNTGRF